MQALFSFLSSYITLMEVYSNANKDAIMCNLAKVNVSISAKISRLKAYLVT